MNQAVVLKLKNSQLDKVEKVCVTILVSAKYLKPVNRNLPLANLVII